MPGAHARRVGRATRCRRCASRPPTATAGRSGRGPLRRRSCASSRPTSCCCTTRSGRRARRRTSLGVPVVMVHHGSLDLDAAALPGPSRALPAARCAPGCAAPTRGADAVMSACDPRADTGRAATLPLRFGLDPAFYPEGDEQRGDHVLYAGRLSREKGVFELLEAAARSRRAVAAVADGRGRAAGRRRRARPPARPRRPRRDAARTSATARRSPPPTAAPAAWSCPASSRRSASSRSRPRPAAPRPSPAAPRPPRRRSARSSTPSTPATRRALLAAIERARAPRARTGSRPPASPPPTAGSARSPPSSPTSRRWCARPRRPRSTAPLTALARTRALAVAIHDVEPATLRALRADPRLARRPRRRPRDAAGDPRAAAAPVPRPLAGARELAAGPRRRRRRRRPARPPAPAHARPGAARAAAAAVAGRRRGRVPRARRRGHDRRRSRPAATCSRAPACSRAASSPPATPTRARCAQHLRRRFDWWATLLALRGAARTTHARAHPRDEQRAQARRVAGADPRRRGAVRAASCGSTCTRPTSTTRATCWRSSSVLRARPRPHRGHLRRPVLNAAGGGRPARELARGRAPRRDAVRVHLPVAAALQAPVVLGLVLSRDRLEPHRPRRGRKQELRTLLRAGRPDGFVPHTAFWQASPRWRRAPLYATANFRGDTAHRSRSRRRCWPSRGSASRDGDPAFVAEGSQPLARARPLADPTSATPTATG